MKIRKFLAIGVAAAALSVTAACGSSDDNLPPVPAAASSSVEAAGGSAAATGYEAEITDATKKPSVEVLNTMLETALDPKVPAKDKVDLVEGAEADPDLFNQLVKVAKENPDVTYVIQKPIRSNGPKRATFKVMVTIPGNQPAPIAASIVFDDGRWKLSTETVCPLLAQGNVSTPLCPGNASASGSAKPSGAKPSGATSSTAKSSPATSTKATN
ncbi:MAG: hypothetical protein WAW85_13530 [Gordonia sp. (in: high G+C Gram-positive bacteria)]|uniref:hypothetical protein n=1 Tax=Gordonia sp. (in: high G+C Gram-positive bacteria) TaxID=84139 RepID=UPI003BB683C6